MAGSDSEAENEEWDKGIQGQGFGFGVGDSLLDSLLSGERWAAVFSSLAL